MRRGGAGNLNLAFELFSEGARQGLDGCMLDLGYFYDEGVGIAIDKNRKRGQIYLWCSSTGLKKLICPLFSLPPFFLTMRYAHLAPDYLKEAMVLGPIRGFRHLFDTDAESEKEDR